MLLGTPELFRCVGWWCEADQRAAATNPCEGGGRHIVTAAEASSGTDHAYLRDGVWVGSFHCACGRTCTTSKTTGRTVSWQKAGHVVKLRISRGSWCFTWCHGREVGVLRCFCFSFDILISFLKDGAWLKMFRCFLCPLSRKEMRLDLLLFQVPNERAQSEFWLKNCWVLLPGRGLAVLRNPTKVKVQGNGGERCGTA